jgi:hypothetical protein
LARIHSILRNCLSFALTSVNLLHSLPMREETYGWNLEM